MILDMTNHLLFLP